MSKRKFITEEEYQRLTSLKWIPFILGEGDRPKILDSLPEEITFYLIGSGSADTDNPHEDKKRYEENQIGGIDVVRYGEDGVLIDVDHYKVLEARSVRDLPEGFSYILDGPHKFENEHHQYEIPPKYEDAIDKNQIQN